MPEMNSNEVRRGFLEYFSGQEHTLVPSSPLIPQKDPTLLFTNAGMVQFKNVFTGEEKRGYSRAVSSQKCMRVGGKHNDLENVGWTARHHTFFEMLGNFSFGDYFKSEAIAFAWELLTGRFRIPADRLWITVFRDDDDAEAFWKKTGVAPGRIVRMGEETNFWAMGDTGPCGPCSELHYDQGESAVPADHLSVCQGVACDCDRYIEIWNLVFMQYDRDGAGKMTPLPKPSIDTGMGLERISAVMQGVRSDYETDLFWPLLSAVSKKTDRDVKDIAGSMPGRVIADHLRAITFLIHDGILPSNEGRGYVLRRIIRRAARYGRELGLDQPFLYQLTGEVADLMKGTYPELNRSRMMAAQVTQGEEERFIETLDKGLGLWHEVIAAVRKRGETLVPGREAFRLYDTYGFPFDLAADMAREEGLQIDEDGYRKAMDEQKDRARRSWVVKESAPYYQKAASEFGATRFVGYDTLEDEVRLIGILKEGSPVQRARAGETVEMIFDRTPFYGESGGQVGDQGVLEHPNALAEIHQTIKPVQDLFVHQGRVAQGEIVAGETFRAVVNRRARWGAARNHTATHLVHAVLREILGEHVKQAGSLVAADRLRFDFSHFKAVTPAEMKRIEEVVNEHVREDVSVTTQVMEFHDALRAGALAFFDDKYGDRVRVVRISDFSKELCGGTHCHQTGEVGLFKLVQETSVAAGMRRIEAITGDAAYLYARKKEDDLTEIAAMLKVKPAEVVEKTKKMLDSYRQYEKELDKLKSRAIANEAKGAVPETVEIGGRKIKTVRNRFEGTDLPGLRTASDVIRDRIGSGIIILGSAVEGGEALLFITVTKDLEKNIPAGSLVRELAPFIDGRGGGRPGSAQAGGKRPAGLDQALDPEQVRRAIAKVSKEKV
jgi:alanyl-tRNA synthetase